MDLENFLYLIFRKFSSLFMSKKECPSCAMEIDENSKVCPICQYEFGRPMTGLKWAAFALAIFLLAYFILF
jgi:predicted amidophosphoribosyltransferase